MTTHISLLNPFENFNFNGSSKHRGKTVGDRGEWESLLSHCTYWLPTHYPPACGFPCQQTVPREMTRHVNHHDHPTMSFQLCHVVNSHRSKQRNCLNEKLHKSWWKLKFPPRGGNQNKFDFCYLLLGSHFSLYHPALSWQQTCPHQSIHPYLWKRWCWCKWCRDFGTKMVVV